MSSVTITLYTSKKLKSGEHPIMFRVIQNRKARYKSSGYSSKPDHWDFGKSLPNKKHPLYKDLTILLQAKKVEIESEKINIERVKELVTSEKLFSLLNNSNPNTDILLYLSEIIKTLTDEGNIGNANTYSDCKRALKRFIGKKTQTLSFRLIDVSFLKKFEIHLKEQGLKESSISVYMRTLRATFNRAIQDKTIKKDIYPFDDYKISKLNTQPLHRALNKTKLNSLLNFKAEVGSQEFHSINFFIFSYYCWGINLMDIALLKWKNIKENRLIYIRSKTKKLYNIPLLEPAQRIVENYKQHIVDEDEYIFPILNHDVHKTPLQIKNRIKKINKQTNKDLQSIASKLGIEEKITTYVARHSFATNLRDLDVSTTKIQHMLGHTSERTTQGYLDSFKNNELDEAAKLLL